MFKTMDGGLSAWNIETGKVARLSERLYNSSRWCGNPEAPLSALRAKNLDWIYFSEVDPDDATRLNVFLAPSDLTVAPRLLFNAPFEQCTRPRVARDGSRAAWYIPEDPGANAPGDEPAVFWVTGSPLR